LYNKKIQSNYLRASKDGGLDVKEKKTKYMLMFQHQRAVPGYYSIKKSGKDQIFENNTNKSKYIFKEIKFRLKFGECLIPPSSKTFSPPEFFFKT
jgi:hypothetical protein